MHGMMKNHTTFSCLILSILYENGTVMTEKTLPQWQHYSLFPQQSWVLLGSVGTTEGDHIEIMSVVDIVAQHTMGQTQQGLEIKWNTH